MDYEKYSLMLVHSIHLKLSDHILAINCDIRNHYDSELIKPNESTLEFVQKWHLKVFFLICLVCYKVDNQIIYL